MPRQISEPVALLPAHAAAVCSEAREHYRRRDYQSAADALSGLWGGVGEEPYTSGLSESQAAELYFLAGALTGHLGRSQSAPGATERAKDLLTRSRSLYEAAGDIDGAALALAELGYWYIRERSLDDALVFLTQAFNQLSPAKVEERAETIIRLVAVAIKQHRTPDALDLLRDYYAVLDATNKPELRLTFHMELAATLAISLYEGGSAEAAREVLRESEIARRLAVDARELKFLAHIENNCAVALTYLGRYAEAHERVRRALEADCVGIERDLRACHTETLARIYLAENRLEEAAAAIEENLASIDPEEQRGLLAESLLCAADVSLARRHVEEARTYYLRAIEAAERVGDLTTARRARRQLDGIGNLHSIKDARARSRTFLIIQNSDAMAGAGIRRGWAYEFRRTSRWRDGDVVAVSTPYGHSIAYIRRGGPNLILLSWEDEGFEPQPFHEIAIQVLGVICD